MSKNIELIETITVGSGGVSSVVFNNISQTYTDLVIKYSTRSGRSNTHEQIKFRFNDNADTAYRIRRLNSDGGGAWSDSDYTTYGYCGFGNATTSTANTFGSTSIYISSYTSSNYKSYSVDSNSENNATEAFASLQTGLWEKTNAINKITFYADQGNNFLESSIFSLYGVSNVLSSPKATGGIISQDSTYWYHSFPYTSSFTPTESLSADILCIAGGGGGAGNGNENGQAGGGGAGGVIYFANQSLTTSSYTITIGAGGATGGAAFNGQAPSGANSQFSSLTVASGGGGGGAYGSGGQPGAAGGSGGGGGGESGFGGGAGGASNQSGSGATAYYGNSGGNGGTYYGNPKGGGGGGAGAAGTNADGGSAGSVPYPDGGIGTSAFSSWGLATYTGENVDGTVYYAGGGGGCGYGKGGFGGGGDGQGYNPIAPNKNIGFGLPNTGGGGGYNYAGGSGLIIVRYAK